MANADQILCMFSEVNLATDIYTPDTHAHVNMPAAEHHTLYPDGLFTAVQEDPFGLLQHSSCLLELSGD
jgi:hypothetical protein